MAQTKKRFNNLKNRCPRGKGNWQQLKGIMCMSKKMIKQIMISNVLLKDTAKLIKKGKIEELNARMTELKATNAMNFPATEALAMIPKIKEILRGTIMKLAEFKPRHVNRGPRGGPRGGRRGRGFMRNFMGMFGFESSETSEGTSGSDSNGEDSTAKGTTFKDFLAGWLTRFEDMLKTENPFVIMRQARFRAKNLLRRIPQGHGNIRRALHILREAKWAVKGFMKCHPGIAHMIKNRNLDKEALTAKWVEISAKRPELVQKLDAKVISALKTVHQQISECEFVLDSENTSSDSSDVRGHKKFWKGGKHGGHGWKKMWKAKMMALKDMKDNMSKEEWKAKKAEWKAKKQEWKAKKHEWKAKGKCGPWAKKKEWFKKKIESKVQEQIDRTIAQAVPQIALQVAQILNNKQAHIPNDLPKMERIQKAQESKLAIHHGYACDGCGVSPIIGDLYKCSVLKDFDFCSTCEATKPHPHAFLKIKSPEQRPTAMFTVVSDKNDKPHPA